MGLLVPLDRDVIPREPFAALRAGSATEGSCPRRYCVARTIPGQAPSPSCPRGRLTEPRTFNRSYTPIWAGPVPARPPALATGQCELVCCGRKALVGYQAGRVARLATSRITSG